jgi:hypothetical protein
MENCRLLFRWPSAQIRAAILTVVTGFKGFLQSLLNRAKYAVTGSFQILSI